MHGFCPQWISSILLTFSMAIQRLHRPEDGELAGISAHVRDEVSRMLLIHERVVWVGQPVRLRRVDRTMAMLCCVTGLAGLALLAVGLLKAMGYIGDSHFEAGAKPWLSTGLIAMVMMLVYAFPWLIRSRRVYVLTNRRALVWESSIFGTSMPEDYRRDDLGGMHVANESGGRGDLVLQERQVATDVGTSWVQYGFEGIANPREIEALVRRTLSIPDRQGNSKASNIDSSRS
jgi:hypothetical protein